MFQNIEANFKKLSNLGLNQGAPGKSCIYLPINLAAAFLYSPINVQNTAGDTYSIFTEWLNALSESATKDPEWNDRLKAMWDSCNTDFDQFHNVTGLDESVYASIAAKLIWGYPYMFDGKMPTAESLTGTLHTKYEVLEGPATFDDDVVLYGNWMYEIFKIKDTISTDRVKKCLDIFKTHAKITVPGKIVVAFSPDTTSVDLYPVGSFEYWYIDPRYRCGKQTTNTSKGSSDISCVLRWTTDNFSAPVSGEWIGHFEILEIFPTISVGNDGKYYWSVNGLNTGIPVTGAAGAAGKNAQIVVVERIENVVGWTPDDPNGWDYWSPKTGPQTIKAPLEFGISAPIRAGYEKALRDNYNVDSLTPLDKKLIAGAKSVKDPQLKVVSFDHDESEDTAWLPTTDNVQLENLTNQNLFRIFRVVGRDKFWISERNSVIDPKNDEYDRLYDPSCDSYYFGVSQQVQACVSHINDSRAIQDYIKELDGTFAIVLPGPAYKQDRTDTTFWFSVLRAVPAKFLANGDTLYQLVAYCSPNTQNTTQLDEHSEAGMMHRLDVFSYKKSSDSRNKPRGLMLPIGSAELASNTPSNTWAAHIIHSDTGGFVGFMNSVVDGKTERRGIQNVTLNVNLTANTGAPNGTARSANNANENNVIGAGQFLSVFDKRVLHVGSVDDFRTLNYVNDAPDTGTDKLNGAVPGRVARKGENGSSGLGTSNFFGDTREVSGKKWFYGSELHVDEPVTITRYRDVKAVGRLLDVEGDVVIGPHVHKNMPNIRYGNRGGGLWVRSTLTIDPRTRDLLNEGDGSIFSTIVGGKTINMFDGVELSFEPFLRSGSRLTTDTKLPEEGAERWREYIGRYKGMRGAYKSSVDALNTPPKGDDHPLFSAFFEDSLGARVLVAEDGIAIFNPDLTEHRTTFSVDGFGNIQTYGREIRSNALDTVWCFHTKWDGEKRYFNQEGITKTVLDSIRDRNLKPSGSFEVPKHNMLIAASDHEVQFMDWNGFEENPGILAARYWRTSNFMDKNWESYDEEKSTDASLYPFGYYHTFGFVDQYGTSRGTFPAKYGDGKFTNWGSSEYLPTVLSFASDLTWVWGGLLSTGINPRAFDHTFDDVDYRMRAGATITFGEYIQGPLRGPIKSLDKYYGDDIKVIFNYKGDSDGKGGEQNMILSGTNTMIESDTNIFGSNNDNPFETPIGSWNAQGAVIEKSMFIGQNLFVHKSASVRGQVRAKSFRRHKSSDCALLLDNGMSTWAAPKYTGTGEGLGPNDQTPIVLDLGATFGDKRLVRFGYAEKVELEGDKVKVTEGSKDTEVCLFGKSDYITDVRYFAKGNVVANGSRKTHKSKEVKRRQNISPEWMRNLGAVDTDEYETTLIEVISTPFLVVVNLYICLRAKWEQEGGNRCMRGIYGAGLGSNDNNMRLWRHLATNLDIIDDDNPIPLPSHPVYANTQACLPAANRNKDGDWKVKGLNGDKPQTPGIIWRLDPNGKIVIDSSAQGMALMGNDGSAPIVTASFMYVPGNNVGGDFEFVDGGNDPTGDPTGDPTVETYETIWNTSAINTTTFGQWLTDNLLSELKGVVDGSSTRFDGTFYSISVKRNGSTITLWVDIWVESSTTGLSGKKQFKAVCGAPAADATSVSCSSVTVY